MYMDDVRNPMTREECLEWIEALESGEFRQGKYRLCNVGGEGGGTSYCCLGVERKIHPEQCKSARNTELLASTNERVIYRLPLEVQKDLASKNDEMDYNFAGIAHFIRECVLPNIPYDSSSTSTK